MQPYISRVLNVHIGIRQNLKLGLEKSNTNEKGLYNMTQKDRETIVVHWLCKLVTIFFRRSSFKT